MNGDPVRGGRRALIALAGLLLSWSPLPLAAQFAVSPVIVQVARSDGPGSATVVVDNEGEDLMRFRVYAMDFDQDRDGNHVFSEAGQLPQSCADRLTFAPDALTIPAGGRGTVQVRLDPGPDTTCWSMLFVESPSPSRSGVRVNQRIGVKLYGLGSAARPAGGLTSADARADGGSLEVRFAFHNPGDHPVRPSGAVEIRDALGQVVASVPVYAFSVLPGHEREVSVLLPIGDVEPGRYLAVPMLDFGGDFLAGAQVDFRLEP